MCNVNRFFDNLKVSMSSQLESMSLQTPPAPAYVLGVRVDRLSQQQALDRIEQLIALYRAAGNALSCQQIITVNTEFVMAAQRNKEFLLTINSAALVIADGIGVVWATHLLNAPAPERITGTDTLVEVARRCAVKGYRLYLLGAAPGVADQAGARLQALAPGLELAGAYSSSKRGVALRSLWRSRAGPLDSTQSRALTCRCSDGCRRSIRFSVRPSTACTARIAAYGPGMAVPSLPRAVALETDVGDTQFYATSDTEGT